jgi:hypothetical protein
VAIGQTRSLEPPGRRISSGKDLEFHRRQFPGKRCHEPAAGQMFDVVQRWRSGRIGGDVQKHEQKERIDLVEAKAASASYYC